MTPKEHDIPETSEELTTTELYPFSSDYSPETDRAPDDTMSDVPVMEQLPDPHALPDPGYPVMPTPGPACFRAPGRPWRAVLAASAGMAAGGTIIHACPAGRAAAAESRGTQAGLVA